METQLSWDFTSLQLFIKKCVYAFCPNFCEFDEKEKWENKHIQRFSEKVMNLADYLIKGKLFFLFIQFPF